MVDGVQSSDTGSQCSSCSSASSGVVNLEVGFFERERCRLIQEISKGVEAVLGSSNDVNRKLEESISVGKEFHPISELWSKFERIMAASGIASLATASDDSCPDTDAGLRVGAEKEGEGEGERLIGAGMATPKKKASDDEQKGTTEETEGAIRFETTSSKLPPGVAPGGGRIYA
ncbi:related to DAD1 - essential subunit of the Dam1 complex [Ustilago sp. UG-2017a]|nr:related to DAD1 - essential subunit of the Dam1 complex [Ustilago sp. UG-2017a]